MNKSEVWIQINDIYFEGNVDWVFFRELYGAVSAKTIVDENLHWVGEISFNKSPLQLKDDALRLAKYLVVEMGDFEPFSYETLCPLKGGFNELSETIERIFDEGSLDEFESTAYLCLQKIHKGKSAPTESEIPDEIVALFQPVSNETIAQRNDI